VKRTLAWLAGIVGIAALGRWLSQHRHQPESVEEPTTDAADPAEELRRRLGEQRQQSDPEPGQEDIANSPAAAVDETLEERRARVHAKAREAIEAMDDGGPAA